MKDHPPIPDKGTARMSASDIQPDLKTERRFVTRDKQVIRGWAQRHRAEPATGEATPSGPATVVVNDGGAGIRFNFPAAARFRPISWDEWFENFDRHRLVFVYDEDVADRAYELWQRRGGGPGNDQEDWFEAERQLSGEATASARYRLVREPSDDDA